MQKNALFFMYYLRFDSLVVLLVWRKAGKQRTIQYVVYMATFTPQYQTTRYLDSWFSMWNRHLDHVQPIIQYAVLIYLHTRQR